MEDRDSLKIAALRGPSAVEMVKMMDDAAVCGGPEIEIFDEPAQIMDAMAVGRADFAVMPTAATRILQKKGIDYRIAAIMIWGGLYVCGTDSGIKELKDLKGRTVNVMAGNTPPEMMLRQVLAKSGINPEADLVFDCTFPTHKALAEAAAEGDTDLCILSEPYLSIALEANSELHILLDIAQEWKKSEASLPPVTAFFCKGSLYDSNPGKVAEMTTALEHSCEWVKTHPADAAAMVAKYGIFPEIKAIEASVPRSYFKVILSSAK